MLRVQEDGGCRRKMLGRCVFYIHVLREEGRKERNNLSCCDQGMGKENELG